VALAVGLLIGVERGWKARGAEEGERVSRHRSCRRRCHRNSVQMCDTVLCWNSNSGQRQSEGIARLYRGEAS
jgi:hypothetical protein